MPPSSDASAARSLLGTWIRGKYRLDRVLGAGGMAIVFLATHRNKKRFAVKMLRAGVGGSAEAQRRFLREGYVANTVDHPGAVSVLDDDLTEDGTAFLVMELLDGAPVDALSERHARKLGLAVTLNIAAQVLDVLAAAHAKEIVHRDIKPANLFVTRSGQVKVLDFGIARLRDATSSGATTASGSAFGTPAFMGPEQALGKVSEIDARADLWAVGATMFWLLTGREVHSAETAQHALVLAATEHAPTLASVMPNAPASVAAIVDRALAFRKAERWATADEMRSAITAAYAELVPEPMLRESLVPWLPPPILDPDTSGPVIPPSDALVDATLARSHGLFASTVAGRVERPADRASTAASLSADLGHSPWTTASAKPRTALIAGSAVAALLGFGGLALFAERGAPPVPAAPTLEAVAAPSASPSSPPAARVVAPATAPASESIAPAPAASAAPASSHGRHAPAPPPGRRGASGSKQEAPRTSPTNPFDTQ